MKGEVGASRPHERGGWSSKGRFGGLKRKIWRAQREDLETKVFFGQVVVHQDINFNSSFQDKQLSPKKLWFFILGSSKHHG